MEKTNLISIERAFANNLCPTCNAAGKLEQEAKPCNWHTHPSFNYRNIPEGMCALSKEEVRQREKEYGTDKKGRIIVTKK